MRQFVWIRAIFVVFFIPLSVCAKEAEMREIAAGLSPEAAAVLFAWESGDKNAALKEAKHLRKEFKKDPASWVVSAALSCLDEKYKKCLKYSKKALKYGPQTAEAYYYRGVAYEGMGKLLDSANEFKAALHARKDFDPAQKRLDQVLARLGNESED